MTIQQGTSIVLSIKEQTALGTPATGTGAYSMEVRPSAGLDPQTNTIESEMFRRNRMKRRPRHGARSATGQFETEAIVGIGDPIFEGVLGGDETPSSTITNSTGTIGSVTITGTGTIITNAGDSWITRGVRAGMFAKFTGMSVTGNNSKWFPIVSVTASVITTVTGILADNALDNSFTLTIAKSFSTPTPYVRKYYTVEEYYPDVAVPFSKLGTDMVINSLTFNGPPDGPATLGFGMVGRQMAKAVGTTFTSPVSTAVAGSDSLVALDGVIYRNGVAVSNVTGASFSLTAPAGTTAVWGTRTSPSVSLGAFSLTGQFSALVEDATDLDSTTNEDTISLFLWLRERETDPADFLAFYIGNASFNGWSSPRSQNDVVATMNLLAGSDTRGTGYADTALLISTSAPALP